MAVYLVVGMAVLVVRVKVVFTGDSVFVTVVVLVTDFVMDCVDRTVMLRTFVEVLMVCVFTIVATYWADPTDQQQQKKKKRQTKTAAAPELQNFILALPQ